MKYAKIGNYSNQIWQNRFNNWITIESKCQKDLSATFSLPTCILPFSLTANFSFNNSILVFVLFEYLHYFVTLVTKCFVVTAYIVCYVRKHSNLFWKIVEIAFLVKLDTVIVFVINQEEKLLEIYNTYYLHTSNIILDFIRGSVIPYTKPG